MDDLYLFSDLCTKATMKYETVPNTSTDSAHHLTLPKIGFGTWSIGGDSTANPKLDSASMTALQSALETGYIHFDTAEYYASGHSEELIGRAVRDDKYKTRRCFYHHKNLA